jgi:hypothetical protein
MPDFHFTPFKEPSSSALNMCAAVEQAALLNSLYRVTPSVLLKQIQSMDELAIFQDAQQQFPNWSIDLSASPRYLVWSTSTGVYAHFVGVYNAYQMAQALSGVGVQGPFAPCKANGNSLWIVAASRIFATMEALDLFDPAGPVYLSGHSMGGAVAYYLGNLIKAKYPANNVQVLTFGCPRTTTRPCSAANPLDFLANVQIKGDFVTQLPPRFLTPAFPWQLNGQVVVLSVNGDILADDTNDVVDVSGPWDHTKLVPHFQQTYYEALKAHYDEIICTTDTLPILVNLGYVPGQSDVRESPYVEPPVTTTDPGTPNWRTVPETPYTPPKPVTGG